MTPADPLHDSLSALAEAADAFSRAAETRGGHMSAPESLASLQEVVQLLSTGWYRLAADARASMLRGDLSREQEVRMIGALQAVAAAFARCARACRDGRSAVTPVIAARGSTDEAGDGHVHGDLSWFDGRRPPRERVA